MIQSDFQPVIGSKTVSLSGSEFGLGVEALDQAARELSFGSEPVEDKRSMAPQHAGDALHRPDLRSHPCACTIGRGSTRPNRASGSPRRIEVLLEQVALRDASGGRGRTQETVVTM